MRNDTLDIAKGVGILLMIIGHMTGMIPFHKWIYQFHMPLFLLISGYFYNDSKYSSFKTLLKVRTKQLLVPYISFFTIIVGTQLLIDPTFKLRSLANGLNHAIWFLLCLYIVELLYWGLLKITNNSFRSVGCCLFIFMVLGFILHHNAIVFPYSICSVPVCMVFYGIGHLCGKNSMICDFMNSPGKPYINLGSSILLLGSLYLYVALTGMHTELAGNLISIYGYLTAIIGSLGIIFVCKLLIFNKMISGGG